MKRIITFITLFSLLVIQSCRSSEDEKMDNYREELQLKSEPSQKEAFKNLTSENKVKIWGSKLSQVLTQDLSQEQRSLVEALRGEIKNMKSPSYDGIKLIELGIELAKITPENEFINMVSELEDYKRDEKLYLLKSNNNPIVLNLQNFLITVKQRNKLIVEENQGNVLNKKRPCDCSWTCGMYSGSSDDCAATESGCGIFWSQPCTGTIRP
ncbi:bacteriocin fulvocin C-related protein [Epilithonimonas hispanica]|uniref:Lipoprotein n=2 Tax=Epilithonimonas TaxID=2782229 RepID=A0A3D9D3H7_9FLAO|nr:bacteriocin fulvocin C-related protein [Epilithonimonas hispanica]REC72560.1 hypothetical protein DRF58_02860 [Epilithonimonas hispanica]